MPLFSVVIASFNRVALLGDTLRSIFAQHFTDFEIIVVDDGSTDDTMEYLQSLGHRVKALRQPNQGPGAARNRGVQQARGSYLAFLDSDDLWFPWTLGVYREVLQKHNDPAFVIGRPHVFPDDEGLETAKFGEPQTERFDDFFASGGASWWGTSAFVIRRDAFGAAGGFNTKCIGNEDVDLLLRLGVVPGFVHIRTPVTFAYRNHVGSLKHDLTRWYAGEQLMVHAEKAGNYPGGDLRAAERRSFLTRHTRAVTHLYLGEGLVREAWVLYRATFAWNASLGRLKYLAGFPLLALTKWTRHRLAPVSK